MLGSESLHERGNGSYSGGTNSAGRKRSPDSESVDSSKRHKGVEDTDSESHLGIADFDPASLVRSREGTMKVPRSIQKYLDKHLRHCLMKEEREALFKEHPRPDFDTTLAPKAERYMSDFLGKKFPREQDTELMKIQTAVLACIRPLTLAWQELLDEGLEENAEMMVPAREVLALIQRSLCRVGKASECVSQTRRTTILEAIDKSWGKFGTDEYGSGVTLFGKEFHSSLTDRVEKDVALSKAVSMMKRSQQGKEHSSPSSRREGQPYTRFFRRGPPARYWGRQGRNPLSYTPKSSWFQERELGRGRRPYNHFRGQRYHEPRLPQGDLNPWPQTRPLNI